MNPVERRLRRLDELQQRHRVLALPIAVFRKAGDDDGGQLVGLLTYYGFLSLMPLLLVAVTVLGLVLDNRPALRDDLVDSALAQLPIVGQQIGSEVDPLRGSPLTLAVGIVLATWTGLGAGKVAQDAMNRIWAVKRVDRPGFLPKLGRAAVAVGVLGGGVLLVTAVAAVTSNLPSFGVLTRLASILVLAVLDGVLALVGFHVLTAEVPSWRALVPGAVLAGVLFAALQLLGSWYVARTLNNASDTYGFFGIVFALLAYLALAAQILLFSAQLNVVLHRRLWPRAIVPPPLTDADRRVLAAVARTEERRPEQEVEVRFEESVVGAGRPRPGVGGSP
jgi:YihY family inner membrane protein